MSVLLLAMLKARSTWSWRVVSSQLTIKSRNSSEPSLSTPSSIRMPRETLRSSFWPCLRNTTQLQRHLANRSYNLLNPSSLPRSSTPIRLRVSSLQHPIWLCKRKVPTHLNSQSRVFSQARKMVLVPLSRSRQLSISSSLQHSNSIPTIKQLMLFLSQEWRKQAHQSQLAVWTFSTTPQPLTSQTASWRRSSALESNGKWTLTSRLAADSQSRRRTSRTPKVCSKLVILSFRQWWSTNKTANFTKSTQAAKTPTSRRSKEISTNLWWHLPLHRP